MCTLASGSLVNWWSTMLVTHLHSKRDVVRGRVLSSILMEYHYCHTFLGLCHLHLALTLSLDVTTALCVIPHGEAHHISAIVHATLPNARLGKSSNTGRHNHSLQRIGTLQQTFLAALHAIGAQQTVRWWEKCESLFTCNACE